MAKTFFKKNVTWMKINNEIELFELETLLKIFNYPGELSIYEDNETGNKYALVTKPKKFHGVNYQKWEKIKAKMYAMRKQGLLKES